MKVIEKKFMQNNEKTARRKSFRLFVEIVCDAANDEDGIEQFTLFSQLK